MPEHFSVREKMATLRGEAFKSKLFFPNQISPNDSFNLGGYMDQGEMLGGKGRQSVAWLAIILIRYKLILPRGKRILLVYPIITKLLMKYKFCAVALQESLPAVQRSANPNTLYLFLVFAEYMPILLPILQRKHSIVNMSGTIFSTMAEVFTCSVISITL